MFIVFEGPSPKRNIEGHIGLPHGAPVVPGSNLGWVLWRSIQLYSISLSDSISSLEDHWKVYGRNYYCRYDYEGVESEPANTMMKNLEEKCATLKGTELKGMKVESAENFEYNDPVDKSVSANQGIKTLVCIYIYIIYSFVSHVSDLMHLQLERAHTLAWHACFP